MLDDPDQLVVQAAARALGKLRDRSCPDIAKALIDALEGASGDNKLAICEGLFRCAESFTAYGNRDHAIAIYDRLLKLDSPHQVRAGALRGAILARGADGVKLLGEYLQSDDYTMFSAAVQTAQEMTGSDVTKVLCTGLRKLSADNKILIFQTLGKRGDSAACTSLVRQTKRGPKPVRIAAIEALAEIGDACAVGPLTLLLADSDSDIAKAAQEAFASIPGKKADAAVMDMLTGSDTDAQIKAVELIARRRMINVAPALLKAARDNDESVRTAAIKTLGDLGDTVKFSVLLDLLLNASGRQEILAAERALSATCTRQARLTTVTPKALIDQLSAALAKAPTRQKIALLRILRNTQDPRALQAVRAAAKDTNTRISGEALSLLCGWPTADALPDVLQLTKTASDPKTRILALRGAIRLIPLQDVSVDKKLAGFKEILPLVQRNEEKKLLLGALGVVNSPAAVELILPYLDNAATKAEAATAILGIAEKILKARNVKKQQAAKLISPLQKVVAAGKPALAKRAKALLRQAKNKAG
jgi:HEAT repeat protein